MATLEHVNLTVRDARATAKTLCEIFDWRIRWEGPAMETGYTLHVGDDTSYVAVFTPGVGKTSVNQARPLNHVGVVVDDIDAVEANVVAAGFTPKSHADYEPGKRFYFFDADDIEYEVVNYA